MAWSTPKTWTAETPLTAAELNFQVRDNLLETAPAKATNASGYGEWLVTAGPNQVAMRRIVRTYYTDAEAPLTTSSTTPDFLPSVFPIRVAVAHGGAVLIFWSASMKSSDSLIFCGPEIERQVAATTNNAIWHSSTSLVRYGAHSLHYGLNPGTAVVRMNFWVSGGSATTGTFNDVSLVVAAL